MCGRFILSTEAETMERVFEIKVDTASFVPRYNIAPGQNISVIISGPEKREHIMMRWGLIPHWAKDIKNGYKMINARAETIDQKPAFKKAFLYQRCLIPANGFFEWKLTDGKKQPMLIKLADNTLFAFPGIWDTWESPKGDIINSCSIITVSANDFVKEIHHRMPVIFNKPNEYQDWLSSDRYPLDIKDMLLPYAGELYASPATIIP